MLGCETDSINTNHQIMYWSSKRNRWQNSSRIPVSWPPAEGLSHLWTEKPETSGSCLFQLAKDQNPRNNLCHSSSIHEFVPKSVQIGFMTKSVRLP